MKGVSWRIPIHKAGKKSKVWICLRDYGGRRAKSSVLWTTPFILHDRHWHGRAHRCHFRASLSDFYASWCTYVKYFAAFVCFFNLKMPFIYYVDHFFVFALYCLSFAIVPPAEGNRVPLKDQCSFYLPIYVASCLCCTQRRLCVCLLSSFVWLLLRWSLITSEGRPARHASSLPFIHLSAPRLPPPQLFSAPCWVSMGSRPNRQTNRTTEKKRKNHHPDKVGLGFG